ncbi:MAG: ABC transporter [Chloroflexi bacterium HGW-Chloroflexi-10]|nr:MAG: ABC transporter [Chloroflexi bacterium HGW-Chloroflexi-10]
MNLADLLHNLFFDYTVRTVVLGTMALGIVSGALGTFALLRKQSLMGDVISHAALPGVVIAFLLTRSKVSIVLIIGAAIAGWLATLWMTSITRNTRIKEDSALGLVLSVFFGFGLMLLTYTQSLPDSRQAGLDTFLFGQAATLLFRDVATMAGLGIVVLVLLAVFWKQFKLISFDREFAASLGFRVSWLDTLFMTLLVVAIVIGLQAVGVVLMSAMVVAPAAAARQWTSSLGVMVFLSALFGALSGLVGALISSSGTGLSTGPVVVLVASAIVVISLFFAPNRGLFWRWVTRQRSRRQLRLDSVLTDLFILSSQHNDMRHAHSISTLRVMSSGRGGVQFSLLRLKELGLVDQVDEQNWLLTPKGVEEASLKVNHNHQGSEATL